MLCLSVFVITLEVSRNHLQTGLKRNKQNLGFDDTLLISLSLSFEFKVEAPFFLCYQRLQMLMNRMQSTSDIQRQDMIRPVGGTKSCFILRIVFNHHHHQQSTQDWKTKMIKKRKRLFLVKFSLVTYLMLKPIWINLIMLLQKVGV